MIDINISRAAWYANNWSGNCPTYREVYLKAYELIGRQLGIYIIFFAIGIVLQAILFRLWDRQKISDKRFKWAMTIITGLQLLWVFNLIGLYLLRV